jgi:hypothetical protein
MLQILVSLRIVTYNCNSFIIQATAAWYYKTLLIQNVRIVSCKIFELLGFTSIKYDPATEFIKLGSTPFKDGATLVPKLADLLSSWKSGSTPLYTGSGILDPDQLTFCSILICQLDEMHHLETRSHCVNMPFIVQAFLLYP